MEAFFLEGEVVGGGVFVFDGEAVTTEEDEDLDTVVAEEGGEKTWGIGGLTG